MRKQKFSFQPQSGQIRIFLLDPDPDPNQIDIKLWCIASNGTQYLVWKIRFDNFLYIHFHNNILTLRTSFWMGLYIDPDQSPICSERSDHDLVNTRPDPQHRLTDVCKIHLKTFTLKLQDVQH